MRSSHTLDRLESRFDDRLVAGAGLLLPATLTQHLDLWASSRRTLISDRRPGGRTPATSC